MAAHCFIYRMTFTSNSERTMQGYQTFLYFSAYLLRLHSSVHSALLLPDIQTQKTTVGKTIIFLCCLVMDTIRFQVAHSSVHPWDTSRRSFREFLQICHNFPLGLSDQWILFWQGSKVEVTVTWTMMGFIIWFIMSDKAEKRKKV